MGGLVALICFCCVSGIVNIAGTYSEQKIPGSRNESIRSQDKPNQKSSGKLIWHISFLQSGWSFHVPMTEHLHTVPQCRLQNFNWINGSLSHIKFLNRLQLSSLFNSHRTWTETEFARQTPYINKQPDQLRFHECYILFVFSTSCRFSQASLPYVNALARAYPHLPVYGVQVEDYLAYKWSLRMLFVPKLKIIVNGKIFNEYSGSDVDLEAIVDFIWLNMRLLPRVPLRVLPVDYTNSPQFFNEPNHICLYASWLITILGFGYIFIVLISRYHWFTSLINGICGLSLGSVRSHGRNQ
ncbi:unnamed protein product [Heterobilharzia americana]|nr:unnamed protein product [Heterobilharzia americana]